MVLKVRKEYSNIASTFRCHSSSVTFGEGSVMFGNIRLGVESKVSKISSYIVKGYYYYNIL